MLYGDLLTSFYHLWSNFSITCIWFWSSLHIFNKIL